MEIHNMRTRRRFHSFVVHEMGMKCWKWKGAKDKDGKGLQKIGGKHHFAHRVSWELHHGPIPEGMYVCRWCKKHIDCVNPNHLFITKPEDYWDNYYLQIDNLTHKSRFVTLSKVEVAKVRGYYNSGTMSKRQLASHFKVSEKQIERIVHGRAKYKGKYWFEPYWLQHERKKWWI